MTCYQKAIKLDPKVPSFWNNRGNTNQQLGKYTEAMADFDEAIRLAADVPMFHLNRGRLLEKLGKPKEALAEYNITLRLDPKNEAALERREDILMPRPAVAPANKPLPQWPILGKPVQTPAAGWSPSEKLGVAPLHLK